MTLRRPHVALVVTALHGVSGGAERVLVDVANGLYRRGYPVTILTYQDRNGPSFYPLDYGIERLDGRSRHAERRTGSPLGSLTSVAQRRPVVALALWMLQHGPKVLRLRRLLRISRPDVVIGFLPSSFTELSVATTGLRVRSVASLHNVPERDLGGDKQRWDQNPVDIFLRRRALRVSDATTVLLDSFVEQLEPGVRDKTRVIPNLVEPYDGPRAEIADGPDNTILAVGRLSPAKDHATLIRAWARIEPQFAGWRLRIIGDGPLRAELDDLIEELDVQRVSIDEPTNEIEQAYTAAKFLVMSSVHEGFGLVTVEAMACGLPVIGFSDCEGTNEIVIDGENGLLVDPDDDRAGSLAAAMRRLIDDEGERIRLGRSAPATLAAFTPERVLDEWENLIAAVCGRKMT